MAEELEVPKEYSSRRIIISNLLLTSNDGTEHDIKALVKGFVIFEDMFSSFLTVQIAIHDANDLIRTAPIIGEETITIEFKSPYAQNYTKLEFRVYGVGGDIDATNESKIYALKCISKAALESMNKMISKAFTNMTVTDIVTSLVSEINVEGKKVEVDPTVDKHSFIAPNVEVNQAISSMIPRARHKNYPIGSAFTYFEDLDRFVFGSIEAMYDKPPILDLSDLVKNLIGNDEADGMLGFEKKSMDIVFDRLNMIEKGAFNNKCVWFDPLAKTFGSTSYSYLRDYDKTNHAPGIDKERKVNYKFVSPDSDYVDQPTKFFFVSTYNTAKQLPYARDRANSVNLSKNKEQLVPFRTAQVSQMLGNLKMRLNLIGNESVRVGETVMINLRTSGFDKENSKNILLSGIYLITAVKRSLVPFYQLTIEISRDCYAEDHAKYLETLKRNDQK